jgi:acyl-CoA thioester hydrolase
MSGITTAAEFIRAFPFHREHEVEFGEIDMLQHVNNARYVVWAETLRTLFFDDVIAESITGSRGVILAKHELQYEAMVTYREPVLIGLRVVRWGTKSFDIETAVWSKRHERRPFRSIATLVAFDYEANHSIVIPPEWPGRVAAYDASHAVSSAS